jgi:IS605 OrfB family transposase
MQKVITGTIHDGDFDLLKQLMRDQQSCVRYAYQRIHKDGLSKSNAVVQACKPLYMSKLNQRYIQDAVLRAKAIKKEHALFGGRKGWKDLVAKKISKLQWHETRDSELYSRGDRTKQGNPNIRVIKTPAGYKLRVGLPGARQFLMFTLYIPEKFQPEFDLHSDCYDVRIKFKNNKYYVFIGFTVPDLQPYYKFDNGVIGIDTNPDGLAVCEIGPDGNLLDHFYFHADRIQFARSNKRKNDIEDLAVKIADYAISKGKGIVLEDLKFNQNKPSKSRKFNRMRHNFIYAQLLQAIERRAIKYAVAIKKINPAFTSIAGILKYQEQYSLNRHTAAAFIIARRGLGIMEKIRVKTEPLENKKLNLAGRGFKIALTKKAYSYFKYLYRIIEDTGNEMPGLTAPCLTPQSGNYGTG